MRLYVEFYEFPEVNGKVVPNGKRYTCTVDVDKQEDEKNMLKEVYEQLEVTTGVEKNRLKIMSWNEE